MHLRMMIFKNFLINYKNYKSLEILKVLNKFDEILI